METEFGIILTQYIHIFLYYCSTVAELLGISIVPNMKLKVAIAKIAKYSVKSLSTAKLGQHHGD